MTLKTASANAVGTANRKDINTAANGVTLEHRHFSFIASVIASLVDTYDQPLDKADVAEAFASACARTNPRFDAQRFLAACEA